MTDFFWQPCLFIYGGTWCIAVVPVMGELPLSIHFIHSVQKTPVVENLVVKADGSGFLLISTKYQSFGVGLPFLESEGVFRKEGDFYIFDHMNRQFPRLSLRMGVGTELTLCVRGREYRLYERFAPGTRIDLIAVPFYEGALRVVRQALGDVLSWKGACP